MRPALYNEAMEGSGRIFKLLGIGLAFGMIVVGVWFAVASRRPQKEPRRIREITLTREEVSITLIREGMLTVRIPEGVFQQQWDDERVAAFFTKFESEDFSAFEQYGEDTEGYILTYTTEAGEEFTFIVPFLDIPIPEVIEELIETLEQLDDVLPTPTPTPEELIPNLRPSPYIPTPTPTPTPYWPPTPTPSPPWSDDEGDYGGKPDYYIPFVCEFIDPGIKPNILSETVCTPQ